MTLGEKIKTLRKEKEYSQEEFAELLDVSRQAISKWESDRGTPEVNKLLQISNIFGVTLDYLLKDENIKNENPNGGYYITREMIDGFLSYKRQRAKQVAIGIGLIIFSDAFSCFSEYRQRFLPLYWISMAVGISILIWHFFQPRQYQEFYSKPLLYDKAVIKSFREESNQNQKRYIGMIIAAVLLYFLVPELIYFGIDFIGNELRNFLECFISTISIIIFITASSSIYVENIVTQNAAFITKQKKRGKFAWIYIAMPLTILATLVGLITNAWSPAFPVIFLFCALLITVCKLLIEKSEKNE